MSASNPYQADLVGAVSDFRQRCFNCPYDDCGAKVRHVSRQLETHPSINNFLIVTCKLCSRKWFVCMLCEGEQLFLTTEKSANKHILNKHCTPKKKRKEPPKPASPATPKSEPFKIIKFDHY